MKENIIQKEVEENKREMPVMETKSFEKKSKSVNNLGLDWKKNITEYLTIPYKLPYN